MLSCHKEFHPSVIDALDLSRPTGRRGHRHAGSASTALSPIYPGMVRFKGGGGIIKSVVVGAALGALTAGIGFGLAMALEGTSLAFGASMLQAGLMATVAQGAIMGGIGGSLIGAVAKMEAH